MRHVAALAASADLISPAAQRWLAEAITGRVLHVFEAAAYLINSEGSILLVARPPLGPGPFTLVLAAPGLDFLETVEVGEDVNVTSGSLTGAHWSVDAATARPWEPRPAWGALRRRGSRPTDALPAVRQAFADRGPRGPFGRVLFGFPARDDLGVEARLQERAREGMAALAAALKTDRYSSLESAAVALAGLGGGFTPAGDDFLMGAMFACWATRPDREAGQIGEMIVRAAAPRTTTASAAWLSAAARGEASWPWHPLVDSLATGEATAVTQAAETILETGHTSGEDALAGFLATVHPAR
ncbi:MAG TPA: DUF2877 domain-containing protein [Anaerolineales bacterium]|nr:DUF2877 domain-containing protein [Anaerolineales bacterium]